MHTRTLPWYRASILFALLFLLSACSLGGEGNTSTGSPTATATPGPTATPTPGLTPTPGSTPSPTPTPSPVTPRAIINTSQPILAFYYMWYTPASWSASTMSDLPAATYDSSDDTTIRRQIAQAAQAGINGFISSWWGQGDVTDTNFTKLLANSALLEGTVTSHFASSLYFESDAPKLQGKEAVVQALTYIMTHYTSDPNFLHYNGKPVLFFWDPLGNGRTLEQWAAIRKLVDPGNTMLWSAEGTDTSLLSVFDGLHLFSGAYWGVQHNDAASVDQGFRDKIDQYNKAHGTQKIWAAGVFPGFDDTRVPDRKNTVVVARNNGDTYKQSWTGALASKPDWVTITSFNEWFEGSMIEPGTDYGALYLTITRQYASQWHT